jgi:hypothetical protein
MIYEVRTYDLKPRSVPQFEEAFAKALPHRIKYSKLAAFWRIEFGPLNQVIHVWPYKSMEERTRIRAAAAKDPNWPPAIDPATLLSQESEIFIPAPFMRPLGDGQALGNFYEMRIYTYRTRSMPKVIEAWEAALPYRESLSPLAAGMHSDMGGLNKWMHIWPYKDLEERSRVRAEASASPHWPPATGQEILKQENKLLIPAPFSPMH